MTNRQPAVNSDGGANKKVVREVDHDWPRRRRAGLVLLITGIVMLMWAWGSWYYRVSVPDERPVLMINHE